MKFIQKIFRNGNQKWKNEPGKTKKCRKCPALLLCVSQEEGFALEECSDCNKVMLVPPFEGKNYPWKRVLVTKVRPKSCPMMDEGTYPSHRCPKCIIKMFPAIEHLAELGEFAKDLNGAQKAFVRGYKDVMDDMKQALENWNKGRSR